MIMNAMNAQKLVKIVFLIKNVLLVLQEKKLIRKNNVLLYKLKQVK